MSADRSAYHRGERAVQKQAGLADQAAFSAGAIGRTIPDVAAAFLSTQPMLVVGAVDVHGMMWCSLLTGPPGFMQVTDEQTVDIAALPHEGDPLADVLASGPVKVGTVAIEPATRRRMRLNGTSQPIDGSLRITTDQVYANCPKYIQKRDLVLPYGRSRQPPAQRRSTELTLRQQYLLDRADTFFIATSSDTGDADANHRGGDPGFLRTTGPNCLRWPDYTGNAMFMTLGNIELNPAAGLLVPDWDTGNLLQLTGTASVTWTADERGGTPGTGRSIEFEITAVTETFGTGPTALNAPQYSRFNPWVAPPAKTMEAVR